MTLNRHILTVLSQVHPYLLPEATLWYEVNLALASPATLSELRPALAALEWKTWVMSVRNEVDETVRWGITALGRAQLRQ